MPVTCPIGRPDAGIHGHSGPPAFTMTCIGTAGSGSHCLPSWCYRPRYLNIQRLNYLWTFRHSPARIADNLIT